MSKAGGGGRSTDGFTVRIIDIHFVQTDPYSFKSVVQSLTGKDSMNNVAAAAAPLPTPVMEPLMVVAGNIGGSSDNIGAKHEEGGDLWVEELDRLLNSGIPIIF